MYINIGKKCIENDKIFPNNGVAHEYFGYSVAILGSTTIFVAPDPNA